MTELRLLKALRLETPARLALVGAGGKSTAMFQLGRQLSRTILTSTTHLAIDQLTLADQHITLSSVRKFNSMKSDFPEGVVLLTGDEIKDHRVAGLSEEILEEVRRFADDQNLPIIIEADGSRMKPLKAPAAHEPLIPEWVDSVVVCIGMSAIGQPLSEQWVHRPGIFAELSGLTSGDIVTGEAVIRMLNSEQGGLKNIPAKVHRIALLNQADSPETQAAGYRMSMSLLNAYHSVIISSLLQEKIFAVHEPVAGIILAAGMSSRMGQAKQLLSWQGEALVHHVARAALAAGLSPVIVVTGSQAEEVQLVLQDLPLAVQYNPDWQAGQSSSIICGLRALPSYCGPVVFLLADQPFVSPMLLRSLVEQHAACLSPLVAPLVEEQRSNPVLFDRAAFPDLFNLVGDTGGRSLFLKYPMNYLTWLDARLLFDVDTPESYARLLEF